MGIHGFLTQFSIRMLPVSENQLYSLFGTYSSIHLLFWSIFSHSSICLLYSVISSTFEHTFTDLGLIHLIFNLFLSFPQPYTDLVEFG